MLNIFTDNVNKYFEVPIFEAMDLRILIIDDDITQLALLETMFKRIDSPVCEVEYCENPIEARELFHSKAFDLVITDYYMKEMSGLEIVKDFTEYAPNVPVVMMTSISDIEKVVEIMQSGVYDFILKPVKQDFLRHLVNRVFERCNLTREVAQLKQQINKDFTIDSIIGKSRGIKGVIETIGRCSDHSVNVLVRGESGTGKELVAHALHYTSPRKDGPFVIVNIAALSESLIESELFGHVKGAFTGADKDRAGRFEQADGGTLFIDEIGDVSPAVQVKLLRAIQFREYQRIGDNKTRKSDVRIIAATSRNLEEMMESGEFRSDLFYRLNVIGITVPPLRDRREDIPLIAEHFLKKHAEGLHYKQKHLSKEATHQLITYDYPGNIRELQNIIEHAVVFSRSDLIATGDLPIATANTLPQPEIAAEAVDAHTEELVPESVSTIDAPVSDKVKAAAHVESASSAAIIPDGDYNAVMEEFEHAYLTAVLERAEWNQSKAARSIGINERRLRYRMERLGITGHSR